MSSTSFPLPLPNGYLAIWGTSLAVAFNGFSIPNGMVLALSHEYIKITISLRKQLGILWAQFAEKWSSPSGSLQLLKILFFCVRYDLIVLL